MDYDDMPIITSHFLTSWVEPKAVRTFAKPRKGKRKGPKVYQLKRYEIPDPNIYIIDNVLICHPSILSQVKMALDQANLAPVATSQSSHILGQLPHGISLGRESGGWFLGDPPKKKWNLS